MASERSQRQIDRLLDDAEEALTRFDWDSVRQCAEAALAYDPENEDAKLHLAAAECALGTAPSQPTSARPRSGEPQARVAAPPPTSTPQPTSFPEGRYVAEKFLGEGGKKQVCLAHDTLLDRDIAFALSKTGDVDDASRARVSRWDQAMGRLVLTPNLEVPTPCQNFPARESRGAESLLRAW